MAISDLLPDFLSSAPTKNPYAGALSDEAWSYYEKMQKRQRVGNALRGVGDYLTRAAVGDYRVRPASGGRGGGGGQNDLLQMMQMQALLEKGQDRSAKRQRQQTKDAANAAVLAKIRGLSGPVGPEILVRGYPGAAPVSARALPPAQPMSGLRSDPGFIADLMATSPKIATGLMFPKTPGPMSPLGRLGMDERRGYISPENATARRRQLTRPKAPKTRSRISGGETINEEFDRATNSWREVGRGPRWDPRAGGASRAQKASDQEIDTARAQMRRLQTQTEQGGGSFYDELQRRISTKVHPMTGMPEPDYNSYWGRLAWLAAQSKSGGDDREQPLWMQAIMSPGALTQPSAAGARGFAGSPEIGTSLLSPADPARSGVLPAPPSPMSPAPSTARTPPPTEMEKRRAGRPLTPGPANEAPELPLTAEGGIDKARLVKDVIYPLHEPNGVTSFWIWNGARFERVGR